jgi:hypothetical protein
VARVLVAVASVLAVIALAGCGASGDRSDAEAVVGRFYDAVSRHDGEAACAELGEATVSALESQSGQSCRSVVTRLDVGSGPIAGAQVFVTSARVELRGGVSAFLDREPDGWRITAVGCRAQDGPPTERPMECEAEA